MKGQKLTRWQSRKGLSRAACDRMHSRGRVHVAPSVQGRWGKDCSSRLRGDHRAVHATRKDPGVCGMAELFQLFKLDKQYDQI